MANDRNARDNHTLQVASTSNTLAPLNRWVELLIAAMRRVRHKRDTAEHLD
jgi:hypothetical protein